MGPQTVEKRVRDESSSPSSELTSNKRQKHDDTPEIMVTSSQSTKVDPSELASAFALASLASLSPSKPMQPPKEDESRGEQAASSDRAVEESVSSSISWEARSPKADPTPITPEVRAPAGLSSTSYNRKVHFAPNTKEQQKQLQQIQQQQQQINQKMQQQMQHIQQQHRAQQGAMSAQATTVPASPHLTASPGRGMVLSPRSPQAQMRGAFMPRSPHPHLGMHAFVRPQHRQFLQPQHHLSPTHPLRHHPQHPHLHAQHQQIPASPHAAWAQGRMFPPPTRLMQPPLLHPDNQWICDFCNVAAFATYEDACKHEESCKQRCSMRPVIRDQHAVTRMRRQGPAGGPMTTDPRQAYSAAVLVASRSNSGDDDASDLSGPPIVPPSSSGEQCWFSGSISLAIEESDHEWLSELNCFVRKFCVEAFSASADDVTKTSKRGRIAIDQVGMRCRFCSHLPLEDKAVAAVSFPTSVAGIYESVKRWQRVHLEVCKAVPTEIKSNLAALANTNVWVPTTRQYWTDSAKALGLVDTSDGIRFGCNPRDIGHRGIRSIVSVGSNDPKDVIRSFPGPSSFGPPSTASSNSLNDVSTGPIDAGRNDIAATDGGGHIVLLGDMEMIPPYVYFLMRQVEACSFTEADRFVARSKGPVGYPGFQCRHCNGHAGLGKYFPISAKSLSTNSTSQNIHAHLLKCRKCPEHVKDRLVQLKIEKGRSPRMEPGWRKVFFDKVWARLHG